MVINATCFAIASHSSLTVAGDEVTIKEAVIKGVLQSNNVDPNGVRIFGSI